MPRPLLRCAQTHFHAVLYQVRADSVIQEPFCSVVGNLTRHVHGSDPLKVQ